MNTNIGKQTSILSRQSKIFMAREFQELNIMPSEYIFIINLEDMGKMNQQELCDTYSLDKAGATRAVNSLVKKGFLNRETNPKDKRQYLISLTDKGRKIKPIIKSKLESWIHMIQGDLSDEKLAQTVEVLELLTKNAMEVNKNAKQRAENDNP